MAIVERDPGLAPGLRDALRSLLGADGATWQLPDGEVAGCLSVIGQARQLLEVAEVALVREGVERGLPAQGSWSVHDWVSTAEGEHAPLPPVRHVAQVVRVAQGAGRGGLVPEPVAEAAVGSLDGVAEGASGEDGSGGCASGVAGVVEAFAEGDLSLGKADQLVRFEKQVRPVADPELLEADLGTLLQGARDDVVETGPEGRGRARRRGLSEKELAAAITRTGRLLKPERDQEREDRRCKAARSLVKGPGPAGMSSYRVVLDAEGAAVLDAAIAALSAPVKDPETGERDDRPAAQRRADALVEAVRRGVSAPGEVARCEKAQVVVTIPLETLQDGVQGAGVTATGQVLPPGVVRRMACDAGVIPAVLGKSGEVLDLGRSVRLFTLGQKRALWMRDQGCTFPGCTMPPQWCDAHHVEWWSRGGDSDLSNAALLCQRHHTRVHDRDLTATVTATGVTWHV